jgi:hypothetical protein
VAPQLTPDRPSPARRNWHTSRVDACAPLPSGEKPRDDKASPLHRAIRYHRAAFDSVARRRGQFVPRPVERDVERELDGFLGCGVLARGFARVRCGACGHELGSIGLW